MHVTQEKRESYTVKYGNHNNSHNVTKNNKNSNMNNNNVLITSYGGDTMPTPTKYNYAKDKAHDDGDDDIKLLDLLSSYSMNNNNKIYYHLIA